VFAPSNPNYASLIQESFLKQGLMATLNASLAHVAPGEIHIDMPFGQHLTQQNGFIHAGAITSLADNACGYAALSLAPPGCDVLAVEFKINLLAPARAPHFQARGRVLRRGRTLTVAQADVFGVEAGEAELIATMLQTVFVRPGPDGSIRLRSDRQGSDDIRENPPDIETIQDFKRRTRGRPVFFWCAVSSWSARGTRSGSLRPTAGNGNAGP
jgi:uncharacterized protein (TIGR00369 family)